jgi:soluble lytic murein transglycosylase-like protein
MEVTNLLTIFVTVSSTFGLPPGLLQAICYVESTHRPHVVNLKDGSSSSYGTCQIKYETAKLVGFRGQPKDLLNPQTNVYYAGAYLKKQMRRYNNNIWKAVSAYNMGRHKTNKDALYANETYLDKVYEAWKNEN